MIPITVFVEIQVWLELLKPLVKQVKSKFQVISSMFVLSLNVSA